VLESFFPLMDDQYIRARNKRTRCFSLSGNIALGNGVFDVPHILLPVLLFHCGCTVMIPI
jgi:hypothetical protein